MWLRCCGSACRTSETSGTVDRRFHCQGEPYIVRLETRELVIDTLAPAARTARVAFADNSWTDSTVRLPPRADRRVSRGSVHLMRALRRPTSWT